MTNIGPQFTPGPWRKERCTLETDIGQRWCGRSLVMGPPCSDGRYCEEDANLISAAPDMFEALADCIVSLCAANLEHLPSLAKARAALAKAEGR